MILAWLFKFLRLISRLAILYIYAYIHFSGDVFYLLRAVCLCKDLIKSGYEFVDY